ncbi:MAG: polyprenyl synthetase family protein [Alphaproteobacteria bacterium]|nr:polyprenyl synthetase family protein [Alphaproteobacteria bacterium]
MSVLETWTSARLALLDGYMHPLFTDAWPPSFADPCRYPLFGGGKRIRPLLVLAAFEAVRDGSPDAVLPAAAAVELVHTYSLVHDDLPCMDDDDERRGRPTVHRAFDEATAVLAGDALLTEAFRVLATAPLPADVRIHLVEELATAAGYLGMVGGQAADVTLGASIHDPAVLERLHRLKTGALLRASVRMGGRAAGATVQQLDALTAYGDHVGLAFQLADDVLDADEAEDDDGPPSFVRLLGVDATRARAIELAERAVDAARTLESPVLEALARRIADRDV